MVVVEVADHIGLRFFIDISAEPFNVVSQEQALQCCSERVSTVGGLVSFSGETIRFAKPWCRSPAPGVSGFSLSRWITRYIA